MSSKLIAALTVLALVELAQAGKPNLTYKIESRRIDDFGKAFGLLRRFVHPKLTKEALCERYLVLLSTMTQTSIDQLYIAKLGLTTVDDVRKEFNKLTRTSARKLYMTGIVKFQEGLLDRSFLDLVRCFSDHFRQTDSTALRFLNDQHLRRIIEQLSSILAQPGQFLVDAKHPVLTYGELLAPIKRYVTYIFGSESEAARHFQGSDEFIQSALSESPVMTAVAQASASASVVDPVQSRTPPAKAQEKTVKQSASASAPAPAPVPVPIPAPAPRQAPATVPAPAPVTNSKPAAKPEPKPVSKSAPKPEPKRAPEPEPIREVESTPVEPEMTEEELKFLETLLDSLESLYNKLPEKSRLNDRCKAYGDLLETSSSGLSSDTVDKLVRETEKVVDAISADEAEPLYLPDGKLRDYFVFVLSEFGPQGLGEVYTDMVMCTIQWRDQDAGVQEFLTKPEPAEVVRQILAMSQ